MILELTAEQARGARAMLKLTQAELAERAGLTKKIVARIEAKSGSLASHRFAVVAPLVLTFEAAGIEFGPGISIRLCEVIQQ